MLTCTEKARLIENTSYFLDEFIITAVDKFDIHTLFATYNCFRARPQVHGSVLNGVQ